MQEWPAGGGIISSSWVHAKSYLGNTLLCSATKDVLRERAEVPIGWSRHWYLHTQVTYVSVLINTNRNRIEAEGKASSEVTQVGGKEERDRPTPPGRVGSSVARRKG